MDISRYHDGRNKKSVTETRMSLPLEYRGGSLAGRDLIKR